MYICIVQHPNIKKMESRKSLLIAALKAGLIIGIVGIAVFLVQYIAGIKPVGILKPILLLLIALTINIVLLVILLKKYRAEKEGYISFGDAFLFGLIALVSATVLTALFNFIFNQFFDPSYVKSIVESQKDWMSGYLSGKIPADQIDAQLDKIDQQMNKTPLASSLTSLLWGSVFGAILALIIGAIMKKKPGIFDEQTSGGVM